MTQPILPVMLAWTAACIIVHRLLSRLRPRHRTPAIIHYLCFLGFLMPIVMIFCLPMDISTVRCTQPQHGKCTILAASRTALNVTWRVAWSGSVVLSWAVLPLVQGIVESGAFTLSEALADSLIMNALFIVIAVILIVLCIIMFTWFDPQRDPVKVIMALTNVVGLGFVIAFLGQGLAKQPWEWWAKADRQRRLSRLYQRAPQVYEERLEAEAGLSETVCDVWVARVDQEGEVYLQILLETVPHYRLY